MHYYQFNIGDYRRDTAHLSRLEHGIYRDLIDWYYLEESPIPKETQSVMRRLRLETQEEVKALENVLSDFFQLADGYRHARIDSDIEAYHAMAEKNRANGKLGGRPKKTQSVFLANPNESQNNPNQEPITINQEPITKRSRATATRLPADWKPSAEDILFCKTERPDLSPGVVADCFRDYWIAQGGAKGRKADWPATWRNWVRNQRAPQTAGNNGTKFLTAQQQRDENNRRSTAEFLNDDAPIFRVIEGACSNA